jgi:hypothetical protein
MRLKTLRTGEKIYQGRKRRPVVLVRYPGSAKENTRYSLNKEKKYKKQTNNN